MPNKKNHENDPSIDNLIHLMSKKPREFREIFTQNPLILLDCVCKDPDQTYAYVKINQLYFNEGNWLDGSNIKEFMIFARENPTFFKMVLLPLLKKNPGKLKDFLEKYPEFKENLKYDFPKEYNAIMELLEMPFRGLGRSSTNNF